MDTALRGQRLLTLFKHKNPIESVSSFILSPKESPGFERLHVRDKIPRHQKAVSYP